MIYDVVIPLAIIWSTVIYYTWSHNKEKSIKSERKVK